MDRELLFLVLCAWVITPLMAAGALWAERRPTPTPDMRRRTGRELETEALGRLLAPLLPAAIGLALLIGWALQEPESAEMPPWQGVLLAFVPALVCLRALARAARSLVVESRGPARTIGLFRPRITVDPGFLATLEPDVHRAVLAHERAHARHYDPLRLWLAQLVTDVQWPFRGARARHEAFRAAVELARDDEARGEVDGTDLATAILAAVRRGQAEPFSGAGIASNESVLSARVERLLAPLPRSADKARSTLPWLVVPAAAAASVGAGLHFGEAAIRWVFG